MTGAIAAREGADRRRSPAAGRWRAAGAAVGMHLGHFAVIMLGIAVAPLLGVTGWWIGLFVNVLCVVYAVALVTALRLWPVVGLLTPGRWGRGMWILLVPVVELLAWALPDGLRDTPPGLPWWALTLLMIGINEELVSRGAVLETLGRRFPAWPAVIITGCLFGLQHLSLLATTGRGVVDIAGNVVSSACYGFFLAAFQRRFHWIGPLMVLHALADFTTILSVHGFSDAVVAGIDLAYVAAGCLVMRWGRSAT